MEACVVTGTDSAEYAAIEIRSIHNTHKKPQVVVTSPCWGVANTPASPSARLVLRSCNIAKNNGVGLIIRKSHDAVEPVAMHDCTFENNALGQVVTIIDREISSENTDDNVDAADDGGVAVSSGYIWQFEIDDRLRHGESEGQLDSWQSYSGDMSEYLENEFLNRDEPRHVCRLTGAYDRYYVDFDTMLQTNSLTFYARSVRRVRLTGV